MTHSKVKIQKKTKKCGQKANKGKEGRQSEMIRSAYKSQKHQQSKEKRGNNKAELIIPYTKTSTSHQAFTVYN
jgi:hypothetical protein